MQRIDIDKISRDVASGNSHSAGEGRYGFDDWNEPPRRTPTVVRVPLWLIIVAVIAIAVMAAHA